MAWNSLPSKREKKKKGNEGKWAAENYGEERGRGGDATFDERERETLSINKSN